MFLMQLNHYDQSRIINTGSMPVHLQQWKILNLIFVESFEFRSRLISHHMTDVIGMG